MENSYNNLASWVYHLDKPIGRSFGDVEYYSERLQGCNGPILEPAVGNGRILIPLLEQGLDLYGFDASAAMLNYCEQELAARKLRSVLKQQRFDDFEFEQLFEAIIIPAGSFQLITDVQEAMVVLKRFRAALRPNGRLILDLSPISELFTANMPARQWPVADGLLSLTAAAEATDYVQQTSRTQLRYEHWHREKGLLASEMDVFALRYWGLNEFELALKEAGFTAIQYASNYRFGAAPSAESHTITFEAVASDK